MTKLPHLQLSVVEAQPKTHPANAWPMSMSFPQRCQDRVLMPPYRSVSPYCGIGGLHQSGSAAT